MQHVSDLQKSRVGVTVLQALEGRRGDERHPVHNSHDMFLEARREKETENEAK